MSSNNTSYNWIKYATHYFDSSIKRSSRFNKTNNNAKKQQVIYHIANDIIRLAPKVKFSYITTTTTATIEPVNIRPFRIGLNGPLDKLVVGLILVALLIIVEHSDGSLAKTYADRSNLVNSNASVNANHLFRWQTPSILFKGNNLGSTSESSLLWLNRILKSARNLNPNFKTASKYGRSTEVEVELVSLPNSRELFMLMQPVASIHKAKRHKRATFNNNNRSIFKRWIPVANNNNNNNNNNDYEFEVEVDAAEKRSNDSMELFRVQLEELLKILWFTLRPRPSQEPIASLNVNQHHSSMPAIEQTLQTDIGNIDPASSSWQFRNRADQASGSTTASASFTIPQHQLQAQLQSVPVVALQHQQQQVTNLATNSNHANNQEPVMKQLRDNDISSNSRRTLLRRLLDVINRFDVARLARKADWKGLFVKLIKVFMQYFLDLMLNDMFGTTGTTKRRHLIDVDPRLDLNELRSTFLTFLKVASGLEDSERNHKH